MEVLLTGTGSPVPTADRGGSSVLVTVDDEPILVDCGSLAVHRLVENDVDPGGVETLFLTHLHVDHTADFFQFVVASWSMGRRSLRVYGPEGTADFVDALYDLYEADIEYRQWFGHPADGIEAIDVVRADADLAVETETWSATARPVEHSIETYAYRFEDRTTGQTCVVSGDTRRIEALADFADGADLLVQDACIAPASPDDLTRGYVDDRFREPISAHQRAKHEQNHCDPADAGWIAEAAGVGTLVLTHLLPNRDHAAMVREAGEAFDGRVVVAEDGMRLTP